MFVLGGLAKNYWQSVRFCAQNTIFIQFNKVFFNIVKDFFKSFEVLCRSEKGQRGSKGEILFVLGSLRKKVLRTLSDFAVFLNIVEDSFKSFEVLSRSGKYKISSKGERIFVLDGLKNKYLARLILRSNYYLYTV